MDLKLLTDETSVLQQDYNCLISDWLLNAEISANSMSAYETGLRRYIKYLNDNGKVSSRSSIIQFKNELLNNFSNSTAYIYVSGIKSFYKYLADKYNIPNVAGNIKLPKIPHGFKKDCLTLEQVNQLLSSLTIW